tara:strand:+ start:162 stop:656 length:495 start_codon:yes stop_codon:yes gene_type:complete
MKLNTIIFVIICILSIDTIYANPDIDELKRNSNNYISAIKSEFLIIKNKIISPYNKKQFHYESFLDSLHFLSEELDTQRKNVFSDLIGLDLIGKDIQFFDNLNRDSILLYNIINGFGRIYYSYLNNYNAKRDYSFKQYAIDMKKLLVLEQKFFSGKMNFSINNY